MPGWSTQAPPFQRAGVNRLYYSSDGSQVWVTSFRCGFWRKSRVGSWIWQDMGTDYVMDLFPHPSNPLLIAGMFRGIGCYNRTAGACKSYLRISSDAGATWQEQDKQVIQLAWSTREPATLFYSSHYDQSGNFYDQSWYQSKLYKGVVSASTGTVSKLSELLDHQSGLVYRAGTLFVAQRIADNSDRVHLYSSIDDVNTPLVKAVFRDFSDDEVTGSSFNILDIYSGAIFINVRTDRNDRGDLFMSSTLDRDFRLILKDQVRGGSLGDFARVASVRGIYLVNVFVPPSDEIVTGITYDLGANWDFVRIPSDLAGSCNMTTPFDWCGMHFLGRSNGAVGQSPYSATGAIGLAMATGNVGPRLEVDDPSALATFLTRDAGVNWKKIASGNNLYAMADRGAVILWVAAHQDTTSLYWTWDEGATSNSCGLSALGTHNVHHVSSSPSRDGLRIHLFTESAGKHYILTADFSSLADAKCSGADKPDTPSSSYESWTAKSPDGEQGCVLGSQITYVRRKPGVLCFNVDNDIVSKTVNCSCDREDYECDDCYQLETYWDHSSACVPKAGCTPSSVNPCANGQSTYFETQGYARVPHDTCVSSSSDHWAPKQLNCVNGNTQPTSSTSSTSGAGTTTTTTTTTTQQGTSGGTSSTTPQGTTTPATPPPRNYGLIAAVVIGLLVVGLVVAFLILRRRPAFQRRFGGKIPFVPSPEEPYSTLGEIQTGGLDEDF